MAGQKSDNNKERQSYSANGRWNAEMSKNRDLNLSFCSCFPCSQLRERFSCSKKSCSPNSGYIQRNTFNLPEVDQESANASWGWRSPRRCLRRRRRGSWGESHTHSRSALTSWASLRSCCQRQERFCEIDVIFRGWNVQIISKTIPLFVCELVQKIVGLKL